ncbi:MAG: F0F1 ATP synthase subunit delta, partial [Ignavibacterium sp.]|nr:F0F1 ATP synthase subunit delta [Ignavibacterium sp.]
MSYGKVAIRYANSFLEASIEKKSLERSASDMEIILNAVNASSLLRRFLENPVVKSEVKKSVLTEIFQKYVSSDTLRFIEFIVDKNRENALKDIAEGAKVIKYNEPIGNATKAIAKGAHV